MSGSMKYVFLGGILLWLHAAYSAAQRKFSILET